MQQVLRYSKGINQDLDKNIPNDGYYFYLKNGRVVSDKQLSQGSVTTIKGNVNVLELPTGSRIQATNKIVVTVPSTASITLTVNSVTTTFTTTVTSSIKSAISDLIYQITGIYGSTVEAFFFGSEDTEFYLRPKTSYGIAVSVTGGCTNTALTNNYFSLNGTKVEADYLTAIKNSGWVNYVPEVVGYGVHNSRVVLFCKCYVDSNTNHLAVFSVNFYPTLDVKLVYLYEDFDFGTIMNEVIVRYESQNVYNVYWLNVINEQASPIYRLNINEPDSFFVPTRLLNIVPDVNLCEPMFTDITSGGNLKIGKIQYSYCLYKKYGQQSNFSPLSALIHLTDRQDKGDYHNYYGSPRYEEGTTTNKSANKTVHIDIPTIDTDYDYIKVVSIWYDTLGGVPQVNIIADQLITSSAMGFLDAGNSLGTMTIESVLQKKTRIKCKTITEKNNILFPGNIEDTSAYVQALEDYDTRAYRFRENKLGDARICRIFSTLIPTGTLSTDGDDISWIQDPETGVYGMTRFAGASSTWKEDAALVPKDHNCVNRFNDPSDTNSICTTNTGNYDYMYQSDGATLGGEGINIKYAFTYEEALDSDKSYLYHNDGSVIGGNSYQPGDYDNMSLTNIVPDGTDEIGSYNSFASPYKAAYKMTVMPDEIYGVSIVWKLMDGSDYSPQWIGDIRAPRMLETRIANNDTYSKTYKIGFTDHTVPVNTMSLIQIKLEFTVDIPSELIGIVQGFSIVSCKRDAGNRTILSMGLINQVEFNNVDLTYDERHTIETQRFDSMCQRYVDAIRHKNFYSDSSSSRTLSETAGTGLTTNNQRRSQYFEYICPELAFNAEYKFQPGVDRLIPAQCVLTGTYSGTQLADHGDPLNDNCEGNGGDLQLGQHDINKGSNTKVTLLSQKIKRTNTIIDTATIGVIDRPSDIDYRAGYSIIEGYTPDPSEVVNLVSLVRSHKHAMYEKYGDTGSDFNIRAINKNLTSAIVKLGDEVYDTLLSDDWYQKILSTDPDTRHGVLVYCIHKRNIYPYGGYTYAARQNRTYYKSSTYKSVYLGSNTTRFIGDTFVNQYQHVRMVDDKTYVQGKCAQVGTYLITYPTYSSINTDLRHDTDLTRYSGMVNISDTAGLHNIGTTWDQGASTEYWWDITQYAYREYQQKRDLNLYNTVYSLVRGWDVYVPIPVNASDTTIFPTRLLASNEKANDELIDSWTDISVFKDKDLEPKYGEIIDLIVWKDKLFAVQECGIAMIAVNERSAIQDTSGDTLTLAKANVFSYHAYVSGYTGCKFRYKFSILSAPEFLYLYDSNRNVMAHLSQSDENASLSDVKGLYSWFNDNIDPNAITFIQSVYDPCYNEILTTIQAGSVNTTIVFSERMMTYEMFLSRNNGTIFFSTPLSLHSSYTHTEYILGYGFKYMSEIWEHNIGEDNMLWGTYYPLEFSALFNAGRTESRFPGHHTVMQIDNIELMTYVQDLAGVGILEIARDEETITNFRMFNSYQDTGNLVLINPSTQSPIKNLITKFARKWRLNFLNDILTSNKYIRNVKLRDTYAIIEIVFDDTKYPALTKKRSFQMSDIVVTFRDLSQTQY